MEYTICTNYMAIIHVLATRRTSISMLPFTDRGPMPVMNVLVVDVRARHERVLGAARTRA